MSGTLNVNLKVKPNTSKIKTGDWVDVRGSSFGGSPSIALFDPIFWEAGKALKTTTPKRGSYTDMSSNAVAVAEAGELWLPSRDPSQISSTSENRVTLGFETTPFTQFYWFHQVMGKTGCKFPFAASPGVAPTWSEVIMKPWWFTTSNNDDHVDQVLPNYNASGASCFGNTTAITKTGNPVDANSYPRSTDFYVTAPTGFGFYQSGDESSNGALDAQFNIQRFDSAGLTEKSFTGDPFKERSSSNPIIGNSEYFRLQWMSQTNAPSAGWSNVMMLTNWMYLATGPNAMARIVLGNASTYGACTKIKPFAFDLWSDSRIVFDKLGYSGYVHLVRFDGAVINNLMGGPI